MKLLVFTHKKCWQSKNSPTGWATDGGFAMHMDYLSKLFDTTKIIAPKVARNETGEVCFRNTSIEIVPVSLLFKKGILNKLFMPFWFLFYLPKFIFEIIKCDAVHAPIPSNIGTVGFLLAHIFNKPLYIRYCGNWFVQRSFAEKFWHWYMEKFAGGKKVFLATGGAKQAPSAKNENIKWIFSSSLTVKEIEDSKKHKKNWSKPNKLCIVCRQEKGKGTEIVIKALKLLKDKEHIFYFDIVGDGSFLNELKTLANKLNVTNQITFHGKLNHLEVLEVLQQNHFFVYPTASEGFPKVVLEAMSQGLIILATPVSVIGDLIIKSNSGFILNERTSDEVVQKLELSLSNIEKIKYMTEEGIQYSMKFTLEEWANTIGEHLESGWQVKLKKNEV